MSNVNKKDKEHEEHIRHKRSLDDLHSSYLARIPNDVVGRYATFEEVCFGKQEKIHQNSSFNIVYKI